MFKITAKYFAYFLGFILLIISIFLIYSTAMDFRPKPMELIVENPEAKAVVIDSSGLELHFINWNLGYAGLNAEMDFFYSGGTKVYPDEATVRTNLDGIKAFLNNYGNADFVLLQEVDIASRRSWFTNQPAEIAEKFPEYYSAFGVNYQVPFVPMPVHKPMGKVLSGVFTLSRFQPFEVMRHSFEGNFSWPTGVFMLDRAFLVNRYHLSVGKELVVVNTHNSAYDDGTLRKKQMEQLSTFLANEFQKGNFIIVGGDWNQCPPNFQPNFAVDSMDNISRMDISTAFMAGWKWAFDNSEPTNRRNHISYQPQITPTTVIDFFLLSPNIELISVKNIRLNFQYSDHQPVSLQVKLKP
ncbi:MAG: endonuclease/exonuclease/phosphatase family protein [Bacteroidales bacterium]|nr:endonuclease/exonuclease/phosphatase family protein [Bacteroidales bacterium]